MTKPFLALLSITLILGVALGGAFVGGIVLGKSQSANGEQTAGPGRAGFRQDSEQGLAANPRRVGMVLRARRGPASHP